MTKYKVNDNGCRHNWQDIGKLDNGYTLVSWCERCGALEETLLGVLGGPDSFRKIPDSSIPHKQYVYSDPGPM